MKKLDFAKEDELLSKSERIYKTRKKGISLSVSRNWTTQAISCYRSNHNCATCSINSGNYSFVCQMPKVVKKLLKEIGKPELTVKPKKLA